LTCIHDADVDSPKHLPLAARIGGERLEVTDDWFEEGVLGLDRHCRRRPSWSAA
jgi:hypothetical protein